MLKLLARTVASAGLIALPLSACGGSSSSSGCGSPADDASPAVTVHALDALSALEGRPLVGDDVWLSEALAADGVDELLIGFWQRRTKGPRSKAAYTATVVVTDGPAWVLDISDQSPVTRRREPGDGIPAGVRTVGGSAGDLYLALWNRGGTVDDATGLLAQWREPGAVTW